jgi:hypothetical protein
MNSPTDHVRLARLGGDLHRSGLTSGLDLTLDPLEPNRRCAHGRTG